jgi:hypothetical protein
MKRGFGFQDKPQTHMDGRKRECDEDGPSVLRGRSPGCVTATLLQKNDMISPDREAYGDVPGRLCGSDAEDVDSQG